MSVELHWRRYRLPFRLPVKTAHGLWAEREGLIIRLATGENVVGFGEIAPLPQFGTITVDEAEAELRRIGSTLPDVDAWRTLPLSGPSRFALAHATAAIKSPTQPRAETAKERTPPESIWPIAALLPAGRAALVQVDELVEAGFRTFKWKVGVLDASDEWALLDDLLARLPERARLRLDANGAWEPRTAERWLQRCADRPIELVEQPIARESRSADDYLLGLAQDFPTSIGLDESLVGPHDLEKWCSRGWPGIWVVKLTQLGDPAEVLAALARVQADVVFSSALESSVGALQSLSSAFTWAGPRRALGYGVWPLFQQPMFDGPHRAPYLRREDLRLDFAELWNALN